MFENITEEQLMSMIVQWCDETLDDDNECEFIENNLKTIEISDERISHKTVYVDTICQWLPTNQFYCVTSSYSNSGYWGDNEKYTTRIHKVVPKVITKTVYVHATIKAE
jgi:hypothetical protein